MELPSSLLSPSTSKGESMVRVSAIVPTCRRPALLERCLTALLAQDLCPSLYEVIVADDAACETTRRQVEAWACRARACGHRVRYVSITGTHGPAAARNAGWRAAQGDILAFTDDDCVPAPGWLRAGHAAFRDGVAGATGTVLVPLPPSPTDYERNAAHLQTADFATANCFYRRAALECIGGFDERFSLAWREDSDLHFRLMQAGAGLVAAPDAAVVHPVRPAPWGISLRQQRKSMYNALLYKKHPDLYRKYIQAKPPWRYYCIVGALLAASLCMPLKRKRAASGALLLWLALTCRFCAQRLRGTSRSPRHVVEMVVTSLFIPPLAIYWRLRGALKFRVWFF